MPCPCFPVLFVDMVARSDPSLWIVIPIEVVSAIFIAGYLAIFLHALKQEQQSSEK